MYSFLANVVVLIHFAFILFVLLGGLMVLHNKRIAWLHIPAVLWGVTIILVGGICPLTPLENWLREQAYEAVYSGDFIAHYLEAMIYPQALTRRLQIMLGLATVAINVAIYVAVFCFGPSRVFRVR